MKIIFAIIALVALVEARAPVGRMFGVWKNELGSIMNITETDPLTFSGIYTTAVSGTGKPLVALVRGTFDALNVLEGPIGFVVDWRYPDSAGKIVRSLTTWSGIVRSDNTIATTWLLTKYCDRSDAWASTLIGKDDFVKVK